MASLDRDGDLALEKTSSAQAGPNEGDISAVEEGRAEAKVDLTTDGDGKKRREDAGSLTGVLKMGVEARGLLALHG